MTTLQIPPRPDSSGEPAWLQERREAAWQRYEQGTLPRKHPRWLHSRPEDFTTGPATRAAEDVDLPARVGDLSRVVLVDGRFRPDLSDDIDGVRVVPLATDDEVVRVHLDAASDDDRIAALNMACWQEGVLLDVQPRAQARLQILHLHTAGGVRFDRVLVHAKDQSDLTLFQAVSGGHDDLRVCSVTELHAHAGARIRRDHFQDLDSGRCLHTTFCKAERDASVADVHIDFGSDHSRNTTIAKAAGAGAHIDLGGLYLAAGEQRADQWTRVDHAVPDTTSRELYKGVLAGSSRTAFTGNVLVRQDAQRTDAEQENRNLLLSRKALAESTPQLEIFADDVQCSHGSTVGQLDEEALFFLQSRGIGRDEARQMLTKAFAGEVVEMLALPAVRDAVTARIETWFSEASQ